MGIREIYPTFKENKTQGPALPGQLFWVPTPQIDFSIIETKRANPLNHSQVEFTLADYDSAKHYKEKAAHLPVKLLQIDHKSEALLCKSKKRPCVILGSASVSIADSNASSSPRQTRQLTDETFLLAPAFSANSAADPVGPFPPDFLTRIAKLHYPHFSWIPPLNGQGPGSVVRLDRIFSISGKYLTPDARCGYKLNPDAFTILMVQAAQVLGVTVSEEAIDEFELVYEEANKDKSVK